MRCCHRPPELESRFRGNDGGFFVDASAARRGGPNGGSSSPRKHPVSSPRKRGSIFLFCLALCLAVPLAAQPLHFTDVTAQAGIRFLHESGRVGDKLLPETLGAGVAFFDADGDGWLDLFFVNSRKWKPGSTPSLPALYLNQKNGTFRDATAGSGLDHELFGLGVAVADFDRDGRDDLYLTALEGDRLYKNLGGGRFEDVTRASGIDNKNFGTSAAWLDYDKDGEADLFVANYVTWSAEKDVRCSMDGSTRSYCTPDVYPGITSKLYRGLGGGRFADVTAAAGLADPTCKALGIAVLDFDGDGWSDLFLANDTQPNKLYRNLGNGKFAEMGLEAGVAFAENGKARGAMGVDAGDYDGSGRPHLVVGNFTQEMLALYRNEGEGLFLDQAPGTPVGRASALALTFAVFFFDAELDGDLDILAVNGHLDEGIERVDPRLKYAQPPLLFENRGQGRFEPVSGGTDFSRPIVGRGAAYGDYDQDGDLDLVLTTNHGPAVLLRNDTPKGRHWLRVRTVGTKSTRNGLGAVVKVTTKSGVQRATVKSGSSYASACDLALTFGLGSETQALSLEVEWPSGVKQRFEGVEGGREWVVVEGAKALSAHPPAP